MFDLGGVWAIADEALLRRAVSLYEAMLAGELRQPGELRPLPSPGATLGRIRKAQAYGGVRGAGNWTGGMQRTSAVAVIPVWGLITQHPTWLEAYGLSCSAVGVEAAIRVALASAEVSAIVLRINSPGGQVHGLPQLADFLLRVRSGEKPIIGHADSNATSAAYMLQACCTEAWASPLAIVGSVGTYIIHTSVKGMDEAMGIKRTMIRMPEGKAAATWDGEDLADQGRREIQVLVDAAYRAVVTAVAKGRKVGTSTVQGKLYGQGAVLDGAAAAAAGMLDGVRSFQDTLAAADRGRRGKGTGTAAQWPAGAGMRQELRGTGASQASDDDERAAVAELELERWRQSFN